MKQILWYLIIAGLTVILTILISNEIWAIEFILKKSIGV